MILTIEETPFLELIPLNPTKAGLFQRHHVRGGADSAPLQKIRNTVQERLKLGRLSKGMFLSLSVKFHAWERKNSRDNAF